MRILDRYILKNFLVPFLYCFFGFIAIWLLVDLTEHLSDFQGGKASIGMVVYFYATQVPQVILMAMPMALLLSLLYSLSRMSRSNEIISILTAGVSLSRLIIPLFAVGAIATALSLAMSYELAPHADTTKKSFLDQLDRGKAKISIFTSQLFPNRADNRMWFVQIKVDVYSTKTQWLRLDLNDFQGVQIIQHDSDYNFQRCYYANSASYNPANKTWTFTDGKTVDYGKDGKITTEQSWPTLQISDWSETPWRILSSNLDPQNLSVPEIQHYLDANNDFPASQLAPFRTYLHYRIAYPAECLVVILIAAPLGIVYSRRGVLVGVASSIFIFFGMMFFDKLFLAFGKHGSIPGFMAAWGTNFIFAAIGLFLLYMRSTNRDPFKWNIKHFLKFLKPA